MKTRIVAVLCALVVLHVATLQAQDTIPERPFVEGGMFDKPYLTTLMGRVAIGGYAEAHARYMREDGATAEAGFLAKRMNLFLATRVSDLVRFGAEIEIEEGGEEILLEYAAVDLAFHPALTLRGGMILSPIGRFNLTHDSPRNEFTDRPLLATELIGVALSEPGFGVFGSVPVGRSGRVTYEAYGVNGYGDGVLVGAGDGTRIPAGKANFEDNNNRPSFVGRVTGSPSDLLEVGVSMHRGRYNESDAEGLELDDPRSLTIAALDLDAEVAGLRVTAEGARATIDVPPSLEGLFATSQWGVTLDVVRDFGRGWVRTAPSSFFSAGVRLEVLDLDADLEGDAIRQVTLGLNFRPTAESVLKLNYVRGRSWDRFNNLADHAGFQASLATYF